MSRLSVKASERPPDEIWIALDGHLDISTCDLLHEALRTAELAQPEVLVVDLRALAFMDSSGLHAILQAQARARADDRRFALTAGGPAVQRVFRRSGLEDRLEFLDEDGDHGG